MADPAHIEAIQAQKAEQTRLLTQRQVLWQLLLVFGPQPGDAELEYRELLQRAEDVIAQALQQEG